MSILCENGEFGTASKSSGGQDGPQHLQTSAVLLKQVYVFSGSGAFVFVTCFFKALRAAPLRYLVYFGSHLASFLINFGFPFI